MLKHYVNYVYSSSFYFGLQICKKKISANNYTIWLCRCTTVEDEELRSVYSIK